MKPKIYLILGLAKHGKTETGKAIASTLHMKFGDTSEVVYRSLANRLSDTTGYRACGTTPEEVEAAIRQIPKEEIRPLLIREGDGLCAVNPAGLTLSLVDRGCRVVAGIRRLVEFKLAQRMLAPSYDVHTWWVDRVPAPPVIQDNTEAALKYEAGLVFTNNYKNIYELQRGVCYNLLRNL